MAGNFTAQWSSKMLSLFNQAVKLARSVELTDGTLRQLAKGGATADSWRSHGRDANLHVVAIRQLAHWARAENAPIGAFSGQGQFVLTVQPRPVSVALAMSPAALGVALDPPLKSIVWF